MKFSRALTGMVAAAGGLALSAAAHASTWVFSGANADAHPVSVSAEITLTGSAITVVLNNLIDNQIASNQSISGVFLEFDEGVTGAAAFTQSGQLANLNGNKTAPGTATLIAGSPSHWGASALTGGVLRFWTLTGGPPRELIAQGASKNFTDLNNGINSHNPYILGSGTFSATLTGGATRVTSAQFLFGTDSGGAKYAADCMAGCFGGGGTGGVPEPATWAMMIIGFGAAGSIIRRRRRAMAA